MTQTLTNNSAFEVAQRARKIGYVVAVKHGKLQFQIHTPKGNGQFDIQRVTDWLDVDAAARILDESGVPA